MSSYDREVFERCIARGTHSERTETGYCVECGYARSDFPEEETPFEKPAVSAGYPLDRKEAKFIQRHLARHEEDTETIVNQAVAPPRFLGTASLCHDGTWAFERRQLERRLRQVTYPEEPCVLFTIWNRPGGSRGLYLDIRSRLWVWWQLIRGIREENRQLDHDR